MGSPYLAKIVLIGYFRENQEAGTGEERDEWAEDVFNRYDQHILQAAAQAGLELSDESRSIIAVLATMAPGTAPRTKAAAAVKTYLEYRGL